MTYLLYRKCRDSPRIRTMYVPYGSISTLKPEHMSLIYFYDRTDQLPLWSTQRTESRYERTERELLLPTVNAGSPVLPCTPVIKAGVPTPDSPG